MSKRSKAQTAVEVDDLDEDSMAEESAGEDEGEDDDSGSGHVTVERLRDLDDWEVFRIVDQDELSTVCTVALRPDEKACTVEYGIWREGKDDDQPGSTGTVQWLAGSSDWNDSTREDALRQVMYRYEEDIGVPEERLVFRFVGPPVWDDGNDDEDEEDGNE